MLFSASFQICNLSGIQKLCDALQENPTWTAAHLASFFALHDAFKHPDVLRYSVR
jgi:calcium-independent phospholipase A2